MHKTGTSEILDLTPNSPLKIMDQRFSGKKAWIKEELSEADWKIKLTKKAIKEICSMTDSISSNPLPIHLREAGQFKIPELRMLFSKANKILNQECGFCVIESMPMEEIPSEEMVECYWILSQLIGRTVSQKWDGTMIYDVTDTGQSLSYGVRGSYTNVELFFHNDNAFEICLPEYVGLFCKNQALKGGSSRF